MKRYLNREKTLKIISMILLGILIVGLFGLALTFLWNWLMPNLFGMKRITLLQGFGIFALSKILFGGFSGESKDKKNDSKSYENAQNDHSMSYRDRPSNEDFEALYEKWWQTQGEVLFEKYVREGSRNEGQE